MVFKVVVCWQVHEGEQGDCFVQASDGNLSVTKYLRDSVNNSSSDADIEHLITDCCRAMLILGMKSLTTRLLNITVEGASKYVPTRYYFTPDEVVE